MYTVFVGGFEVNDFLLSLKQAENLAAHYQGLGYDDVAIVKV
jgi:hypothetical protein